MKVAITGANGFLGSYLIKECLRLNFQVIALVRKGANLSSLLTQNKSLSTRNIDYQKDLILQFQDIKKEFGALDFFIHNAGVTVSLNKQEYFDINSLLTDNLIQALEKSDSIINSGKFVYISSYAAHGPKDINKPVSLYGESKRQAEELIGICKLNSIIFRPTAIYGAGDYAFLPLFKAAKKGLYPITSSKQKMSMIHGADLATIIISEMQNKTGTIFVNDGKTYTHQDFIDILEQVFKRKIFKIPVPSWASKISLGLSDIWHRISKKRPGLTLEKFEEISKDWNLHECNLPHSSVKTSYSLKAGFEDAHQFYKTKNLL